MSVIRRLICLLMILMATCAWAGNGFVVKKIEAEGLQRVSLGTFLSYMPIQAGDRLDSSKTAQIIQALYKTGFFSDVSLYQKDNNVLLVKVVERPTIGTISISGNKKIKTAKLLTALKQQGFAEGEVFDHAVLVGVKQALLQQYYNLGHYDVHVATVVTPKSRNRVVVNINVAEGPVAKIQEIKIIGNRRFTDKQLLKGFTLSTPNIWTFFTNADQYAKEKLDADLETLRSYYLDRGCLEFKVDSTQVSITPDKQHVYIIIHVIEGPLYTVSGVTVSGNLLGKRDEIQKLVDIKSGDIFSRQKIIDVNTKITRFLGDMGYAFANINPQPKIDKNKHRVFINFVVQPGKRVYVQRISFEGNTRTADYVLRREMRQMEGGLFSLSGIDESKRNLDNLGYLEDVHPELKPVPGQADQVDLQYHVKEKSSAAASLQLGYSDMDGLIYGASVDEHNFMGTGNDVGIQFNNSDYSDIYSIHYSDPYYTKNHISRDINVYYQHTTPDDIDDVSDYAMNIGGASINYGIPLSEYSRLNLGYGYEYTGIKTYSDSANEVKDFVDQYGGNFDNVKINGGWQFSDLDRMIFPTKGFTQSIGAEAGLPVFKRNLEYYKASYEATAYLPVTKYFVFDVHGYLGYGNGYGKMKELPFFENYFAGGIGSVRGYSGDALGPLDSNGDAIGGNVSLYGSVGLVLPSPMPSIRPTVFLDVGNVYDKSLGYPVRLSELRYSTGIQIEWNTPFAPLVFSLAAPIHKHSGDDLEPFQFQIGVSF